jgi:hypothetical protein
MIAKSWLVVGVALLGAAVSASLFPSEAFAAKKKGSIKCTTDRLGKFSTNASKLAQGIGGYYALNTLAIEGGSARVSGTGTKVHTLVRAFQLQGDVSGLGSRNDFPVTFSSILVEFTEVETNGIPGLGGSVVTKTWAGSNEVTVTLSNYKDLGIKKGRHQALVQGSFSGSVPVFVGDTAPLAVSDGSFSMKIEVQ